MSRTKSFVINGSNECNLHVLTSETLVVSYCFERFTQTRLTIIKSRFVLKNTRVGSKAYKSDTMNIISDKQAYRCCRCGVRLLLSKQNHICCHSLQIYVKKPEHLNFMESYDQLCRLRWMLQSINVFTWRAGSPNIV